MSQICGISLKAAFVAETNYAYPNFLILGASRKQFAIWTETHAPDV